jgi:hypothetical protein
MPTQSLTPTSISTRPRCAGHDPTVTNLKPQTFDLQLSLDTTGYAYAVVLLATATAPTVAEVKALTGSGGGAPVASGLVLVGRGLHSLTSELNLSTVRTHRSR